MKTICHPANSVEQAMIVSQLAAADIPFYVVGEHYSSLYPGPLVSTFNESLIQVPDEFEDEAMEIVQAFLSEQKLSND